jgi:hypothetical protein
MVSSCAAGGETCCEKDAVQAYTAAARAGNPIHIVRDFIRSEFYRDRAGRVRGVDSVTPNQTSSATVSSCAAGGETCCKTDAVQGVLRFLS